MEEGVEEGTAGVDAMTDVRAAGGLVWRPLVGGAADDFEVIVVHRPRYDDWSLPKGKHEPGEDDAACALREVEEETGLRCVIERALGSDQYQDRNGRPKQVTWFLMRPVDEAEPHQAATDAVVPEVDEVRWMSADDALILLSYEHDRLLVAGFDPSANPPT